MEQPDRKRGHGRRCRNFATTSLTDACGPGRAGGLINPRAGVMTLNNVTLSDNHSAQDGGAIANAGVSLTMTNVTVSRNSAISGGGIANRTAMNMNFVTIAHNSAPNGGDINNFAGGNLTMRASIVDHALSGGNCAGAAITSQGDNISSDATCNLAGPGDRNNLDPRLGALARHGGYTWTLSLRGTSPAVDAATHTACPPPATDQRGVRRPRGRACDIGAYERKTGRDDDDDDRDSADDYDGAFRER